MEIHDAAGIPPALSVGDKRPGVQTTKTSAVERLSKQIREHVGYGMLVAATTGMAFLAAAQPAQAQAEFNLTMASPYPDALFHVQNIRQFIQEIEAKSEGRIEITLHPAQSLFNHAESMQALRSGQVDLAELQLTQFGNQEELYNFESLPYLADSFEEAMVLWDVAKPYVDERLAQDRIMHLYTVPWPPQAIYANHELESVADTAGLKLRVYNPMGARMAELLGAEPVLVGGGEVPQAFSTGMIDSMITSSAFGASASAWDYVDVFNDVRAWFGYDQILMNARSFQRLPNDLQQVVLEAAKAAGERGFQMSKEANEEQMKVLADNGMTVAEGNPEFTTRAAELTTQIVDEWVKMTGEDGAAIVSEFRKRTQ